jgi:hypothetical protein
MTFRLSVREPNRIILISAILLFFAGIQVFSAAVSEPFFNGDETRHVMTGVFFRDAYLDRPLFHWRQYATDYYLQYPALGIGVWPPLFYAIEGAAMLVFGPSILVSKFLMGIFGALAVLYLFLLVESTHDRIRAAAAAVFFATAPMILTYSRQVMLEIPTLAFLLMALFYWIRYLDRSGARNLWLATGAATAAALTRFDAAFLIVTLVLLINSRERWSMARRPQVMAAGLCAIMAIAPVYWVMSRELGSVHWRSVSSAWSGAAILKALQFYPACLPQQIGWLALVAALCGLGRCLWKPRASLSYLWPYLTMLVSVYMVFTPIGERTSRHAIYWIPAWSVLAVEGIEVLSFGSRRAWAALAAVVGVGTLLISVSQPTPYVRGYAEAAKFTAGNWGDATTCFFDGWLDGDFIYQLRLLDPQRRFWVLRGDKLLYSVVSGDKLAGYAEYTRTDDDILATLYKYGPGLIVVESKSASTDYAVAERLRAVLTGHPERFALAAEFPIETNISRLANTKIQIFRNLARDPAIPKRLEMEMLMLGHPIGTALPNTHP